VRGLAHIGVLKVLEEAEIPIHAVTGTSAGGLIGALYAAGVSPQQMEEEARRMASPRRLLPFLNRALPFRGILSAQKVAEYLESFLDDLTFDQLRIPLAVVAVDLNSGQKVVLNEGRVVDAVRATTALPGLIGPVERGRATSGGRGPPGQPPRRRGASDGRGAGGCGGHLHRRDLPGLPDRGTEAPPLRPGQSGGDGGRPSGGRWR
jgi:predicted acylesterase/phospholipase RssA